MRVYYLGFTVAV